MSQVAVPQFRRPLRAPHVYFGLIAVAQLAVLWVGAYKVLSLMFGAVIVALLATRRRPKVQVGVVPKALLAYASVYAYMAISAVWAPDPVASIFESTIILAATVPPFLFGRLLAERYSLRQIAQGLGLIPIAFALQAAYNSVAYGDPMLVGEYSIRSLLGGLACLVAPILLGLYFSKRNWLTLIQFGLTVTLALSIQSRSAMLIVGPAVLFVVFVRSRRLFAYAFTVCVLLALGILSLGGDSAASRFSSENTSLDISESVLEEASKPVEDRVDFDRRLQAFVSVNLFLQNPVFGGGYSSVLQTNLDDYGLEIVSHGFIPGTLGELGIVGLALISVFLFLSLKVVAALVSREVRGKVLVKGYAAGFVALIAYGFFHQTFESAFFTMIFGVLIGAASTRASRVSRSIPASQ